MSREKKERKGEKKGRGRSKIEYLSTTTKGPGRSKIDLSRGKKGPGRFKIDVKGGKRDREGLK